MNAHTTCPMCGAPVDHIASAEGTNAMVYDPGELLKAGNAMANSLKQSPRRTEQMAQKLIAAWREATQ